MEILFILLLSIFLFLIVMITLIPIYTKHKKASHGIVNYDALMREFVYKVSYTKQEILNLLKTKNSHDEMDYDFYPDESKITFHNEQTSVEFALKIIEKQGFCIVILKQIPILTTQNHIPLLLNPFMTGKLNAEIILYSSLQE